MHSSQAPPSAWLFPGLCVRRLPFCPSSLPCLFAFYWSYSKKLFQVDYGSKSNLQNKKCDYIFTFRGNTRNEKVRHNVRSYKVPRSKFSPKLLGFQKKVGNICCRIHSGHKIKTKQLLERSITFPGIKI